MKKLTIRELFKLLENTIRGIQHPLEKLRRRETANASLNSDDFIDPAEINTKEEERLKDAKACPGDSGVDGGLQF